MVQEQLSPTERQKAVLRAVIHDYIYSAEPVGSRSVARRYAFHLGPASIRNIMADMEELGYLAQDDIGRTGLGSMDLSKTLSRHRGQ